MMGQNDANDKMSAPDHGWTCFHCGEHFPSTFKGQQSARIHFGDSPIEQPACLIDARAFRAMQDLLKRYQSEDTELHREIFRMRAQHATALRDEEEKGYSRGLREGRALRPSKIKRSLYRFWASFRGYFALPCPQCGTEFYGFQHERCGSIPHPARSSMEILICPECTARRIGESNAH